LTDTELVAKTLAGDMRALETLIRLHNGTLYRTARAILRDDAEAEDAVQDAFLQAFRALGSFRGESKLSTWLVRIAANEALMRLRRNANAAARTDVEADELVSREAGPERTVQSSELRQLLEARIGALPEDYRAVFMLRAIEELSVEETAAALGIPEATVRTRYFRARNLLRKALAGDAAYYPGRPRAPRAVKTARGATARNRPRHRRRAQGCDLGRRRGDEYPGFLHR
jgi:RNA polymerase sigma-70 factor (ECF subfamily)